MIRSRKNIESAGTGYNPITFQSTFPFLPEVSDVQTYPTEIKHPLLSNQQSTPNYYHASARASANTTENSVINQREGANSPPLTAKYYLNGFQVVILPICLQLLIFPGERASERARTLNETKACWTGADNAKSFPLTRPLRRRRTSIDHYYKATKQTGGSLHHNYWQITIQFHSRARI